MAVALRKSRGNGGHGPHANTPEKGRPSGAPFLVGSPDSVLRHSLLPLLLLGLMGSPGLGAQQRQAASERLSEPARWLQGYLRIDTTNPPGNEGLAASYLAEILHREGIPTRRFITPEGRVSLYARLPATRREPGSETGAILLTHHMDVVPPGPGWTVEPFAGLVRGGRMWGRGALDTKGLGIAHLTAFVELKRRKVALDRDVVFLAVPDEETGSEHGMAWLFEHYPEIFDGIEVVLNEGGSSRVGAAGMLWWEVEVAQKRPLWLEVRTRGWGGHASAHIPESASHQLIKALARVLEIPRPYRVTPVVRRYFQSIGPLHQSPHYRRLFGDIDAAIKPEGPAETLLPGLHRLFVDSLQVSVIEVGESINVVEEDASARIDIRLLPDTDEDELLAQVRSALGPDVEVEVLLRVPRSEPSPVGTRAWRAMSEVLERDAAVVPSLSSGFTDSRHFRARGVAAYGLTPFVLNAEEAGGIHAADESIPLVELKAGADRVYRILRRLLGN